MKKLLLTGAFFATSQILFSQTLTSDNLKAYKPGYSSVSHYDTVKVFTPDAGGTGKSWDFSTLASHIKDTVTYIPVAGTPLASIYPTSTVVEYSASENRYDYYTLSNDGVYANSFSGEIPGASNVNARFTTPVKLLSLPAAYGNTWTATNIALASQKGPAPLDSTRGTVTLTTRSEVDASGSVTTPFATYANALRIKTYIKAVIQAEIKAPFFGWQNSPIAIPDRYDTVYNWVADGAYVVTLSKDTRVSTGGAYNASFSSALIITGVENTFIPGVSLALFPNPVQDRFQVSGVRNVVSIADLSGKEVSFTANPLSAGTVEITLSTPEKGLYIVQTLDNQGVKKALKFTVVK